MCSLYRNVARMVSYRKGIDRYCHEPMGIPPYLSQSLQPSYIISTFPLPTSYQYSLNLIPSPWRWGQEVHPKHHSKFIILPFVITQRLLSEQHLLWRSKINMISCLSSRQKVDWSVFLIAATCNVLGKNV